MWQLRRHASHKLRTFSGLAEDYFRGRSLAGAFGGFGGGGGFTAVVGGGGLTFACSLRGGGGGFEFLR